MEQPILGVTQTVTSPHRRHVDSLRAAKNSSQLLDEPALMDTVLSWGRSSVRRSWLRSTLAASPVVLVPLATLTVFITLAEFDGCLSSFLAQGLDEGFVNLAIKYGPRPTYASSLAVFGWVLFQAALYQFLPGPICSGQRTPAGHLLSYRLNGLGAWIVTHVGWAVLSWYGVIDPGFIPRHWGGLVAISNMSGLLISAFAYVKAHLFPTHPDDCRFSGEF